MAGESPPSADGATLGSAESPVLVDRVRELETRVLAEEKKLALVQEIGRALSSGLKLEELLGLIMEKITLLMENDRSTLYLMTDDGEQLWSQVVQGGERLDIRLRVGEGIAGWVAASGETVNIPDAYIDKRFQPAVDLRSGYRTRSILCMPMRNSAGDIIGVVQCLNKLDGPFTAEDEALLSALASQASMLIDNSKLYHSVVSKNVALQRAHGELEQKGFELNVLYEIEQEMAAAYDLDELLERILLRAMEIVGAKAGSIALRSRKQDKLVFRTTAGEHGERVRRQSIPIGEGIIGWVAQHGKPLSINDPGTDSRHAAEFAEVVGLHPKHLLCAPLIAEDEILGAIELLDKLDDDPDGDHDEECGFSEGDLKLLELIAGQASRAIQLARAKSERENQNRLASIGQMLAGVLHDLKTPMTIISGYAQLMAQIDDTEQREAYVEQIQRQFDLMSGMTREVLAFARGETTILKRKVYLHRFLDEAVAQLRHELAGKDVEVVLDAGYKGVAYFDEQKMLRLIHNLARNAAQAMRGGGGEFRITTSADDDTITFEFSDNGPGIPPEMEGRLFDLFATARKEGGTGLGLAIVKKIVDEHDGRISYESSPGVGTTFRVALSRKRPAEVDETGRQRVVG